MEDRIIREMWAMERRLTTKIDSTKTDLENKISSLEQKKVDPLVLWRAHVSGKTLGLAVGLGVAGGGIGSLLSKLLFKI